VTGRQARLAGVLLVAGIAVAVVAPTGSAPAAAEAGTTRYVVSTVRGTPSAAALEAAVPGDVTAVRPLGPDLAVVTVRGGSTSQGATAAALESTAHIEAAAPDARFTLQGAEAPVIVRDSSFGDQWDLWDAASLQRAGGYGVDVPRAWQRTKGSRDVIVAVLDTGITPHPDLPATSAQVPGYDFVSGADGIGTGDGDGWDPDPRDEGDACTWADDPDSSWHGTFVAGEIAALHDGRGVAGEAPGVRIEPVRVLGACGGMESDEIAAIEWASGGDVPQVPHNDHPADVINLSLSGRQACDPALQLALADAVARGTTVIAAAGNDDGAIAGSAPANCAGVISVAATTRAGNRAPYSNHGTTLLTPTVAAPGGSDSGLVLGDTWTDRGAFSGVPSHAAIGAYAGTSMAAPRVSAAVALLLSIHPGLLPAAVASRLRSSVTPFPATSTCTVLRCGAGIVNAGDLLAVDRRFVHATRASITGTPRSGHLLTAHAGLWRPAAPTVRYRWYRGAAPIPSATHATYRLGGRDRGASVSVRVTVLRTGYHTTWAQSPAKRIAR
jgi:serine protease